MTVNVPAGTIATRREEGHFWKRGKVHTVAKITFSDKYAGGHVVTWARTQCGELIAWPMLFHGPPAGPEACRRCKP